MSILTVIGKRASRSRLFLLRPLGLLGALAACGGGNASLASQFSPDFSTGRHAVSVFGVYKDGQMSSGAWDGIASRMAHALGATRCEAGYSDALASTHGALSSAIEDYARSNGPTDDLLVQLAPAAQGDLILVFTFAGKLPPRVGADSHQDAPSIGAGGGGGRGGMQGAPPPRGSLPPRNTDELDLSASLFSPGRSASVAVISMRYLGTSVDEAVSKLAAKLHDALPNATCAGWNWDANVDAERIRHSIDDPVK